MLCKTTKLSFDILMELTDFDASEMGETSCAAGTSYNI